MSAHALHRHLRATIRVGQPRACLEHLQHYEEICPTLAYIWPGATAQNLAHTAFVAGGSILSCDQYEDLIESSSGNTVMRVPGSKLQLQLQLAA